MRPIEDAVAGTGGQQASIWSEFMQLNAEHLFFLVIAFTLLLVFLAFLGTVIAIQMRRARETEMQLAFKHELIDRGMSAGEIERIMLAGTVLPDAPSQEAAASEIDEPNEPQQTTAKSFVPISNRRLVRSDTNRWLAGVFGGLGSYLGIDPVVLRIAFILVTLFTGPGIFMTVVAYIIWVFVVPKESDALRMALASARYEE